MATLVKKIILGTCVAVVILWIISIIMRRNTESFSSAATNYDILMASMSDLKASTGAAVVESETLAKDPIYDPNITTTDANTIFSHIRDLDTKKDNTRIYIDEEIIQDKIQELSDELDVLGASAAPTLPPSQHTSIKNPFTGISLNMESLAADPNANVVYLNGKCMSYTSTGNYDLKDCNFSDTTQIFTPTKISTIAEYNAALPPSTPANLFLDPNAPLATIPSFHIVRPASNSGECLTISNDANGKNIKKTNVSIKPCTMSATQQHTKYNHPVKY